jgi:hypothetical protein
MKTLSVPIEEQYAQFITDEIASGKYKNETDVITEALRLLETAKKIPAGFGDWGSYQKKQMDKVPLAPREVYFMLPEMKIELLHGKIIWGGKRIKPDTEFEAAIAEVINRYMAQPSADIILFAAYLTECVNTYNKTVYDPE